MPYLHCSHCHMTAWVRTDSADPVACRHCARPLDRTGAGDVRLLTSAVRERFGRLGRVVEVPEHLAAAAGGLCGVGPAYWALLVEAQVDAGVRRGLSPAQATALVTETMSGTAELLAARGNDTLAVRRAVTSPGGVTAKGLAVLEAAGVRAAFSAAMDAVVGD